MSASVTSKKQCVTCNKSGGILICDGCQQSFCGKHVIAHRQELAGQLDHIMQEHDLLRDEFMQPSSKKNSLLSKIDKWEKDSIVKIQAAAERARATLQALLDESRERLAKKFPDIAETLRASLEADDFSEQDLDRWRKQLKDLTAEITSPSAATLIPDKSAPVYPMMLQTNNSTSEPSAKTNNPPPLPSASSSRHDLREKFLELSGSGVIDEEGCRARQVGPIANYAFVRGQLLYSGGCHNTRFKLENFQKPYHIFFGCVSDKVPLPVAAFRSTTSVGWFGFNQVYEQGHCSSDSRKYGYHSGQIQVNDILRLTLDCTKRQLRLFNERSNVTNTLNVNFDKTPYPWRLLMVLFNKGDCVRILSDA